MMRGSRVRLLVASGVGGHGMEERFSASQVRELIDTRHDDELIRAKEEEEEVDDDELDEDEDFDEDDDDFDDDNDDDDDEDEDE
jgi:hypothetical protein